MENAPKGAGVITDATLTTKQKYEDIETTTNQSKEVFSIKLLQQPQRSYW